jgi:transcriptional regulator with XRE-family HTH domain
MMSADQNHPDPRSATVVDRLIGERLRIERQRKGLSQSDLAKEVRITFQQIQKYEKGLNRISAARLMEIARFLGVPISVFFRGL